MGDGYDQVFKGILRRFFQDFMELFFPDVAGSVDFDSVELLEKERRRVQRTPDFVVRVWTREGTPENDDRAHRSGGRDEAALRAAHVRVLRALWL